MVKCNIGAENYGIIPGGVNFYVNNAGISVGILNLKVDRKEEKSGSTVGVVNIGKKNIFQSRIYNQAESGLQIGLLNHYPNALIPWMPLFNFSFDNKKK